MPDRLQSYRNQVSDAVDAWQANVCNPYIIAYNLAYKSYTDTFKKQSESDKARAELFVTAAAILPGSILMATAATSSLRVLANRGALRLLAGRSTTRALGVYNAVAANATATFAIGKALDIVKDETGKVIKDSIVKAMSNSRDLLATDPLNRDKQLNSWLINHKLLAFEAADAIERSGSLSERDKARAYDSLRAAPIANKPKGKIDPARLAPKIELGFYMVWVLDSDELVTQTIPGNIHSLTSKPIDALPSSRDYPRGNTDPSRGPVQWVGVTRPGGDVEDQIDKVHKQVRGNAFYVPGGWFGKSDAGQARLKEVAAAERTLTWLSDMTQPLAPLGLRT